MSKKAPLDMSSLLATKGQGAPANDAPTRPIITETHKDETTNRRIDEDVIPSSELVNLGFKVPREFRQRVRLLAAEDDINQIELLRRAIELYAVTANVRQKRSKDKKR